MAKAARAAAFVVQARPDLSARVLAECVAEARQAGEHAALDRAERLAEALGELRLRVAPVVGELDRFSLLRGELAQRLADRLPPGCELRFVGRLGTREFTFGLEGLGAPALLAADEIDRAAVDERQQPRARLRPLRGEPAGGSPDAEEGVLHCVLRQGVVAEDPERKAVGQPAEAAVELGKRLVVCARDQRQHRLVRQMRKLTCGLRTLATPPAERDHASFSPVAHRCLFQKPACIAG